MSIYGNPSYGQLVGGQEAQMKMAECVERNPTVEENIDAKINMLKAEIVRLEESKKTLAPLLHMRIRDIREAMNY